MSRREILLPWVSQPQEAVDIASQWRDDLLFAHTFISAKDILGGIWTSTGSPSNVVNGHGLGVGHNSSYYLTSTESGRLLPNAPECSWLFVGTVTTSTTQYAVGGFGDLGLDTARVQFDSYNGTLRSIFVNTAGSAASAASSAYANGTPVAAVFSVSAGKVPSVYVRGIKSAGSAGTGTVGTYTGVRIGAIAKLNSLAHASQESNLHAAFRRALTDSEALALCDNPWQIFAPRRIWVPVSAASGPPTLAAIAASNLTASGARLTVT